jgi:hypothetical protein
MLDFDCQTDRRELTDKEYTTRNKRIMVEQNNTNLHIGLSQKTGFQIAQSEYVCFSNHDDYSVLPLKLLKKRKGKLIIPW